ncbi:hypothetical protein LDENG_00008130 [Lucifuga dentata]|nr:hypothetical protein LDENG_00008130 [Lucifuga dentata]
MDWVHCSLDGEDADWFFFDGINLRLNSSSERILDRVAQDPVLIAELKCYEEDVLQNVCRIMVEILNENDNFPVFEENTVKSLFISELTPVNSLVFTVQATDADNDKIIYSIDQTSPDAAYFKIDLPNSGQVLLSKPLDYETKTLLNVTIHASEMSTAEHFNISTTITITVLDGDDQYPQFLPCTLLLQDETTHICSSPVYTVNITEGEEDISLDFYPGPIHAVDGDRGLSTPVSYAILSGNDDGHFLMDRETGEMRLIQGVKDRLTTPTLHLQVMAYQNDDPRKYTVATLFVHVLAANQFHPEFEMAVYHGFVTAEQSPASLVNTYGSKAMMLHVHDQDFMHGINPMIYFTFNPTSNYKDIYHVTQQGLVIARASQLKPKQKHILEVMAVDQESGDATFATIVVEVLPEGQAIPLSPLGDDRLTGCVVGKALVLSIFFMSVLGCFLTMLSRLLKRHKGLRDPLERGCVAQGKHPNVSLQWFQLASYRSAIPQMEEIPFSNEEYGTCNPSFSLESNTAICTHQDLQPCQGRYPPRKPLKDDQASVDMNVSPTHMAEVSTPPKENLSSPTLPQKTDLDCTEAVDLAVPDTSTSSDVNSIPSFTCPDSLTTPTNISNDHINPSSHTSGTLAQKEKSYHKPPVNTSPNPSYSTKEAAPPLQSSPYSATPPPTLEHKHLKAKLVHIEMSPHATPPGTSQQTCMILCTETPCQVVQPSKLDQTHPSGHPVTAENSDSSPRKTNSTNSENIQDSREEGDEGEHDKISESDDDLEADEEELLRVLACLNPTFISFSK